MTQQCLSPTPCPHQQRRAFTWPTSPMDGGWVGLNDRFDFAVGQGNMRKHLAAQGQRQRVTLPFLLRAKSRSGPDRGAAEPHKCSHVFGVLAVQLYEPGQRPGAQAEPHCVDGRIPAPLETMGNHCLLVFTGRGIESFQKVSGGAGVCASRVLLALGHLCHRQRLWKHRSTVLC